MATADEIVKRLEEIKLPEQVAGTEWFQQHFINDGWTLVVVKLKIGRYIGLYPKAMFDLSKSKLCK